MSEMNFWFDFISPYAFFAWLRVPDIASAHHAKLHLRPILFAALLEHHGQLGPAEIPSKREHTFKDIARYAALNGIHLKGPAKHPFNPLTALRCALPLVCGERQVEVIDTLYRAGWSDGIDLGDPDAIAEALSAAGLDGRALIARASASDAKEALKAQTAEAIARGVFGVPTVEVDGELFWGNDRLDYVTMRLQGRDPLPQGFEHLLDKPAGATRPRR